jgi:hypothetical protein
VAIDMANNPIEAFIKQVYEENIKNKPTFDEGMQEHIKKELERLKQEAIEFNRQRENGDND